MKTENQPGEILEGRFKEGVLNLSIKVERLDSFNTHSFKQKCDEIWENKVESLVIDLIKVEFMDSSGVGALLGLHKRLPPEKPRVKLLNLQPQVKGVLELLRLHRVFEMDS